jgi:hypothetical protein
MQLTKDYIIGLVDGEGSFTVYLRKTGKYRKVECHFYIKLVEDDLRLLKKIRKTLNCGNIYLQRDKRKNHSDCYRFEVGNLKDIKEKIIPLFKGRLQSKKRKKDFEIFCRIVELVSEKKHLTLKGWKEIEKLKNKMHR